VALDELQTADLVFFKTGWKTRHVGIYIGEGQFLHASTSRGVMISSLDNPYWQRHYWTSRRVPLPAR
jgi:cell wall-associated NlpC family hydrolase